LCNDTPIPAPLPLLERVLEVLVSKPTKGILQFPLNFSTPSKGDPLAAALSSGRERIRKRPNLVSKVDEEV
jgi:hypothetical protein